MFAVTYALLSDCCRLLHYNFDSSNKVAEVIAYGEVRTDGDKSCTDKLEIVREIPWDEVLRIVNIGKNCTGRCNTGNRNTGDWNTGDWNTGDWNKSSFNTGCFNTEEQKIMLFNKPSNMTYREWLESDASIECIAALSFQHTQDCVSPINSSRFFLLSNVNPRTSSSCLSAA